MQEQERASGPRIDRWVFWIAIAISAVFVAWGILFPTNLYNVSSVVLIDFLIRNFSWVFILSSIGFVGFCVYLAFSRYGGIRLGGQNEQPEFRTVSWVAMMFSAGMGIGLMFYGVAEPMSHMSAPPGGLAQPNSLEAGKLAMEYSYFHWMLHPWAIYAVLGLALAYFGFRKGMPNLISTAFYPLLGDRVRGPIGKGIDILAITATLFGSATSLGLGAVQMNGGLNSISSAIPLSITLQITIIAVLTVLFILSAVSGVHRGIQWLSNANMVMAAFLVVFVFIAGGAVFILNTFAESMGGYIANFVPMSFRSAAFFNDFGFLSTWTIFYWAWWISWAPFVGTFIARISRGRTIRQFMVGVLLVPSVISGGWFAIFGGAAIGQTLEGSISAATVAATPETSLFVLLSQFPLFALTSTIAIILVGFFFVSGADAASVVMGMLSSGGAIHPRRWNVIVWGTLTGAVAAVALLAGGENALTGLQYLALASGGPFVIILIALCFSLMKALKAEHAPGRVPMPEPGRPANRPWEAPQPANGNPEPGRAANRPTGAPEPQQARAEEPEDYRRYRS